PSGIAVPLEVRHGRCEFSLPGGVSTDKYYLVVGSTSLQAGPHAVDVTCRPGEDTPLPIHPDGASPDWLKTTGETRRRIALARVSSELTESFPALAAPPAERVFHLFARDQRFTDPNGYVAVTANLAGVGQHCQIYVDREYGDPRGLQAT